MTPHQALGRFAVGYALMWCFPLALWLVARIAHRRGRDRTRELFDDYAKLTAASALNALPLTAGAVTFALLVGGAK